MAFPFANGNCSFSKPDLRLRWIFWGWPPPNLSRFSRWPPIWARGLSRSRYVSIFDCYNTIISNYCLSEIRVTTIFATFSIVWLSYLCLLLFDSLSLPKTELPELPKMMRICVSRAKWVSGALPKLLCLNTGWYMFIAAKSSKLRG